MWSMHRNSDQYSEPEKFIPERFMDNITTLYAGAHSRVENRDQHNFGWGRRTCPGIHMVKLILSLTFKKAPTTFQYLQ